MCCMFLFIKAKDLLLKYGHWRFETRLLGWGSLLEVPTFWFGNATHLGFIFLYHRTILNIDAYSATIIQGT